MMKRLFSHYIGVHYTITVGTPIDFYFHLCQIVLILWSIRSSGERRSLKRFEMSYVTHRPAIHDISGRQPVLL